MKTATKSDCTARVTVSQFHGQSGCTAENCNWRRCGMAVRHEVARPQQPTDLYGNHALCTAHLYGSHALCTALTLSQLHTLAQACLGAVHSKHLVA